MSGALQKMREFVESYPGADILSQLSIDFTDKVPNTGGLFPSGLVEVRRRSFIDGTREVDNQYNFALYTKFTKVPEDDFTGTANAAWLMEFQEWVQEQSVLGAAPAFGDDPRRERIFAGNGELYSASDEGTALYVIRISVNFTKRYERI